MSASAIGVDKVSNRRRFDSNGGRTVSPEPASSKSYMDSVMSFVKGLSQAYSNNIPVDEKEPIVWARFFTYAEAYGYETLEQDNSSVFLVLGYVNGVQMWYLSVNGDAQEMFSLRDGPVKTACLLPPPPPSLKADELQTRRPLLAICLATDSKQIFASVSIISLRSGEQVRRLQFPSDIVSLQAGPAPIFIVALKDSIHAFDMTTLNSLFVINDCCCVGGNMLNPVVLGTRWLVYSPNSHITSLQSLGGFNGDGTPSYVTSMLNAAKTISKGISTVGDTVNWLASKSRLASSGEVTPPAAPSTTKNEHSWSGQRPSSAGSMEKDEDGVVPGLVTILDVQKIIKKTKSSGSKQMMAVELNYEPDKDCVVAHFVAHSSQPLACMCLSPSGTLLATADILGHAFHIFSVFSHPAGSNYTAVHHLYTLWRGTTPAQVQELRFSWDCRWFIASTLRGTCHIFPVSPYGGTPNLRTHTSVRIVNRTSTFRKSAGLNEMDYYDPPPPTRRPRSESPTPFSPGVLAWHTQNRMMPPRPFYLSPRHPPFPDSISLQAVGHIRLGISPTSNIPGMLPPQNNLMASSSTDATATPLSRSTDVVIATRFLHSTRKEKGGANGTLSEATKRLLVVSSSGYLTEYHLDPRPYPDASKATDESPVAMVASERICWPLQRQITWNIIPLSLHIRNPLLAADNLCRRHYDLTRCRLKKKAEQQGKVSSTCFNDFPPLESEGSQVRCEQPRSLEKTFGSRNGKRSKSKKSSWSTIDIAQAPESSDMQRNGVTSENKSQCSSPTKILRSSSQTTVLSYSTSEEWLSQVEMITHEGPARRLWMGPQFHFKRFLSTGNTHVISSLSSALLSNQQHVIDPYSGSAISHDNYRTEDLYEEELDVKSLNILPIRSDPVPTPAPRQSTCPDNPDVGCYTSISIEAGSGNFDRTARMLEIKSNGSVEERRYSSLGSTGRPSEDVLIEKIADAMQDCGNVEGKFTPSSSPRRKVLASKHDVEDLVIAESFDFKTFDSPSLHLPTDT